MKAGFEKFKKRVPEGTRAHERSRRVKVAKPALRSHVGVAVGFGPLHAENVAEGEEVDLSKVPKLALQRGAGEIPGGFTSFYPGGGRWEGPGTGVSAGKDILGGQHWSFYDVNNPKAPWIGLEGPRGSLGQWVKIPGEERMGRVIDLKQKGYSGYGVLQQGKYDQRGNLVAGSAGYTGGKGPAKTGQFRQGYGVGERLRGEVAPATRRAKGPYRDLSTPTGPLGMGTQFFETPESEFPRATPAPSWGGETPGWFRPGLAQGEAPPGQVSQPTYMSGGVEYAPTTDPKNPGYVALSGPNEGQVVANLPGHPTPTPTPTPAPAEPPAGGGVDSPPVGEGGGISGGPFQGWSPEQFGAWHSGPGLSQMGYESFTGQNRGLGGEALAYPTTSYLDPKYGWVPQAQLANAQASTNPLDYFNPFGNTSKGGSGTGGPTQRGVGLAVGTVSNLLLPGSGFITGPLSRYLTSLVQKQHPNATPQQVQRIVQAKMPPMPSGSVPLPTHGGGYDPGAGVDPYGNPTRGREWYSSDFGRNAGETPVGNYNLAGPGGGFGTRGLGFTGHTVGNFGTAIGFGGNLGGDAVVNAGALGGGAMNRHYMQQLAQGKTLGSPGGYSGPNYNWSPSQGSISAPGIANVVNPQALVGPFSAQQSRHIGQRQEQQKGTSDVPEGVDPSAYQGQKEWDDLIRSFRRHPVKQRKGPQFDPKDIPIIQDYSGRYYDPEYSAEDELLMAKKGKHTVQVAKGRGPRHAENAQEGVDLTKIPTDTVDAKLTPREAVLNRNAAELAGRGNIEELNAQGNQLAEQGVDLAGGKNMKPKKMQGGGNVSNQPAKLRNPNARYNQPGGGAGLQPQPYPEVSTLPAYAPNPQQGWQPPGPAGRGDIPTLAGRPNFTATQWRNPNTDQWQARRETPMVGLPSISMPRYGQPPAGITNPGQSPGYFGDPGTPRRLAWPGGPESGGGFQGGYNTPWGSVVPPAGNPGVPPGGRPVPLGKPAMRGGFYPQGQGMFPMQSGSTDVPGVDPIADLGGGGTAYGAPVQLSAGDVSKFQKAAQQAGLNQNQIAGIMQALKGIGGAYGAATGGGGALYGSGGGEISPLTAAGGFQGGISDIGYPPFVAPTAEYHADNAGWRGPYDSRYFLTGY